MSKPESKQILEGSRAIALTIKNIAPAVVSAYPITPQTHIVEDLAKMKADGQAGFEYIRAESEFAAASIVLGASAAGSRVYSATSSQGLLLMAEVVYNISGLRLPIVMTTANRAISSPINIWNDHSDVMSIRDAGWIQLFAANHQEAVNAHILAYKLAEKLKLPVMINVDGYILTHSYESVIIPEPKKIKKFLPAYRPENGTYLNPDNPVTLGAFFTPAHYMETREALHEDLLASLEIIKKEYREFQKIFKDETRLAAMPFKGNVYSDGLVVYYGPNKPKTILVALGSLNGTILETIKDLKNIGLLKIKVYRPFPAESINKFITRTKNIAVIEKAINFGQAGPLYCDIKAGLSAAEAKNLNIKDYIVGLGGRDVTKKMISKIIKDAGRRDASVKFVGND
ncbi:MAG: pyruvate ferredoxin oxidoreductase [Candidatus Falkowbacteria bacterium]|nr:pyruvate ferredoxin oxidoreductase [Candidatus Falkowbacteria bacterium]